jgi:cytidylate kinase
MRFKDYLREASKKDILKRYKKLKKMDKDELVSIYTLGNQVNSISTEPKTEIINAILFDEFREIDIELAFNNKEIK